MDLSGGGELAETQAELQAVKRALRNGEVHLGMRGDNLSRYLLQLSEKENLLLSRQLQGGFLGGGAREAPSRFLSGAAPSPASPARFGASPAAPGPANGVGPRAAGSVPYPQAAPAPRPVGRPPPPGPPQGFDRNSLPEVLAHMCDYEAVPLECTRALRALASLAYANAAFNVEDARVLPQLLRIVGIHADEPQVQLAAMRVLCNVAYDPDTALSRLLEPGTLIAILKGMDGYPSNKELATKASEAAARIVAAEACAPGAAVSDGGPVRTLPQPAPGEGLGALAGFFAAAIGGDSACHRSAVRLAPQLLENEVVSPDKIARAFVVAASTVPPTTGGTPAAWGWLSISKQLGAEQAPGLQDALIEAGAIPLAAQLMEHHAADAPTQLVGIEAMSALIGNRWAGLHSFAEASGVQRIEAAMRAHGSEALLQTKGIRALACGVQWPEDVQQKASYAYQVGIDLTKTAMALHGEEVDLQTAGLEALAKYLDKLRCVDEVKAKGGEGLVKAMMTRHLQVSKVQTWGKIVLDGIGVDRHWVPRAMQGAS